MAPSEHGVHAAGSGACPKDHSLCARLELHCCQQTLSKAADSSKWKCSAKKNIEFDKIANGTLLVSLTGWLSALQLR